MSEVPDRLPFACPNYRDLFSEVDAFLGLKEVQQALSDDCYRLSGQYLSATPTVAHLIRGQGERNTAQQFTFDLHARRLFLLLNQTQKLLFYDRRDSEGVLEVSKRMEKLGLLINGSEFRSDYSLKWQGAISPPVVHKTSGLQLHYALATEMLLYRTTGELDDKPDDLVTRTNGLHIGLMSTKADERISARMRREWMCGATRSQLEGVFSSGYPSASPGAIRNKVQGKLFRDAKMHADATKRREEETGNMKLPPGVQFVTITAEEGGKRNIDDGAYPVFFKNAYGIGPQDPARIGIDFRRDNIREQVEIAMGTGLISRMVIDY